MKYILELDESTCEHECGMDFYQCKQVPWLSVSDMTISKMPPYTEIDRKDIEEEVWNFANDAFWSMTQEDIDECYDGWFPKTYQEAKAKYEAWKKQKDEIHVGDEVAFEMAFGNGLDNNMKAVALDQAATGEEWCVLTENGCIETHDEEDLYKTGRHFPEVAELLKKMRGEEE